RDGDFQRELNKAVANNWITIDLRNRYRYQLTATGLCREADDRPGTWPSDEFRKTIEVGLSH
ncbi:MAG: hypothetical protein WBA14_05045, partial [Pseudolabrys sp.]